MPRRLGFLVNPIAGLGARVGLKGTDDVVEEARKRGAKPEAGLRARRFLDALPADVILVTAAGAMGEDACGASGVAAMVVHVPSEPSTREDTRDAVRALLDADAEALVFVGGDGTAADVLDALHEAGKADVPILGVPAGSKMYSSVFADTPEHAAVVAEGFDDTREGEVLDIDEAAYRAGELRVGLKGLARVPHHRHVQAGKLAGADDEVEQESLADAVAETLRGEPGIHVLGAGGTMLVVKAALGLEGTLLGIDVARVDAAGGVVMERADVAERDLLACADVTSVVLSPIGGQGFLLGRGNLPLSPAFLRRVGIDRIRVVATPSKLIDTPALKVDSGDPDLDRSFPSFVRVKTGWHTTKMQRVIA